MQIIRVRARAGHPWVFANDVLDPPVAALKPGGTVEVLDAHGQFLGRGYANPHSLITIRMLTGSRVEIDADFFRERLRRAVALRERVVPGRRSYRLCAGEADGLGGLILDRYEDVLVAQITTLGMETRRDALAEAIDDVIKPRGVIARDDASSRGLEGLGGEARLWFGEVPQRVSFEEAGVAMEADPWRGQKTGYFFDQADNRAFLRARAKGARVLDLYANTGGWALQALAGGASEAVAVESSAHTASLLQDNAARNGFSEQIRVVTGDARAWARESTETFDIVCVDPPAFAKNRKSAAAALSAYKQVNASAIARVAPGGLLFTSSCSHHILEDRFEEAVDTGARSVGRAILRIRRGGQAPDHPVLPGVPETAYLKHLVYVVR